MPNYKLLTPGPLTTTDTVKKEMLFDHCTWDDDYKKITLSIREKLLKLAHVNEPAYTVVLMQGSGTFGVESVLTSVIGEEDTLLIAANGAYGERMGDIARHAGIHYLMYKEDYNKIPSAEKIGEILKEHPEITHVSMVHSETTSGILNDIASVAKVVKGAGKTFIVDAMSSFGGVDIPVGDLGIRPYIGSEHQGPIITTFLYPEHHNFSFQEMYQYIKDRGYAIYPGKVTDADTFRVGNIGEIYKEDIEKLCSIIREFLEER